MKTITKSIKMPNFILQEINPIIKDNNLNFTDFIIEAIKTYIRILNYNNAINKSFGSWKNNNHPELQYGIHTYIRKMRKGRGI